MKLTYKDYEIIIFSIKKKKNRELWRKEKIILLIKQFYYQLSMKHSFNTNEYWLDDWLKQNVY